MDRLDQASEQLADIESQIQALVKRREALRAFVELGNQLFTSATPTAETQLSNTIKAIAETLQKTNSFRDVLERRRVREGTAKARIEQIAASQIRLNGNTQTADVLEQAEAEGVEIGAANKLLAVSSILSRSPQFSNDRSLGWTLAKEKPEGAPTLSGSSAADAA